MRELERKKRCQKYFFKIHKQCFIEKVRLEWEVTLSAKISVFNSYPS